MIFPLELGTLTIVSCTGGLFVYEEYERASGTDLVFIFVGIIAMMVCAAAALHAYCVSTKGLYSKDPHSETSWTAHSTKRYR